MRALPVQDIAGHIYEFSLDQHGSRFIQQKLESVALSELAEALDEVLPRCITLMTDVFGNYVVQVGGWDRVYVMACLSWLGGRWWICPCVPLLTSRDRQYDITINII